MLDTIVKASAVLALLSIAWLATVTSIWVLAKAIKTHWIDPDKPPADLSKLAPPTSGDAEVRPR